MATSKKGTLLLTQENGTPYLVDTVRYRYRISVLINNVGTGKGTAVKVLYRCYVPYSLNTVCGSGSGPFFGQVGSGKLGPDIDTGPVQRLSTYYLQLENPKNI